MAELVRSPPGMRPIRSIAASSSAICAVLDMLASGDLPQAGFVRQEQIPLAAFLANRFGRNYAAPDPGLLPGVRVA